MLRDATTEDGAPAHGADASSDDAGAAPSTVAPGPGGDAADRPMTGLVVDDHAIARRGVLSLARETFGPGSTWTGAASASEALELARTVQPDMVLVDVRTAGHPSGPALVAQLVAVVPAAQVVVTVGSPHDDEVKRCLETGAAGALWKGSPEEELALVLRQIDGGDRIIDAQIAARLQERAAELRRAPVALTDRERTVLELLAEGCSNREIGRRLVLSPATIKDHVRHLLQKLGATSRLQALVHAADAGMLQLGTDRSR